MADLTLYHYWRSSASWRVRWALELKGLKAKMIPVNLLTGESESKEHLKKNPLGYVPVLETAGNSLIESVAIIEWLEENYPQNPLIPGNSFQRAHLRSLVEIINASTQPISNIPVLDYYSQDEEKRRQWNAHFIKRGLEAYATRMGSTAGDFSVGDQITIADLFLIPQVYGALRFDTDLSGVPKLREIYERALLTPSCAASHPDRYK